MIHLLFRVSLLCLIAWRWLMAVPLMIAINVCIDAGRLILFGQAFVSRVRGVGYAFAQCGALWTSTFVLLYFQMHREAFYGSIIAMAHDFSWLGLTFPAFHHLDMIRL